MTWWKGLIAGVLVLGSVAITVAGLQDRPPPPTEVQLGKAKVAPIVRTVAGAGKVQAATTVKISSSLSGDLLELNVHTGDQVIKGQVLGRIDRKRFEANVRQAQAAYNAARGEVRTVQVEVDRLTAELGRLIGLVEQGVASKAEQDNLDSQLAAAKSRVASLNDRSVQAQAVLDEAQTNLNKTTLVSPIDGTVIEQTREVGERVRGSDFSEDVVMTLAALATMEVQIEVGEHEVVHLKLGQKADVKIDALEGQTFEGEVVEIAQKALVRAQGTEQETTTFPVKVALSARPPGVLPGMSSEVRVIADRRDAAVTVPVQAVTVRPEKSMPDHKEPVEGGGLKAPQKGEAFTKVVFVVDDKNVARVRRVRTGIASDTDIEIVDGLKEGDQVVEGPYRTLAKELNDGDAVEEGKGGFKRGKGKKGPGRG